MPPPPTVLSSAVPSDPANYDIAEFRVYTLEVVSGDRVRCETTASSGDVDLYLRWNAEPTGADFACSSTASGENEVCEIDVPGEARLLWVLVKALSAVSFCHCCVQSC